MPNLEQLLIQTRLVSPTQLAVAQRDAAMRRKRLAQTIIDLGIVTDRRFAEWVAEVSGRPLLDPLPSDAVSQLQRRIPRGIAREYEVLPVALDGNRLTVATVNPLDTDCINILGITSGFEVKPVVAVYGALAQLVAQFYPEDDAEATILPPSFDAADDSTGSSTRAIPAPAPQETQLDRIERRLADLERRLDAIQAALARVLPP